MCMCLCVGVGVGWKYVCIYIFKLYLVSHRKKVRSLNLLAGPEHSLV